MGYHFHDIRSYRRLFQFIVIKHILNCLLDGLFLLYHFNYFTGRFNSYFGVFMV